jgi:hypothetical protein
MRFRDRKLHRNLLDNLDIKSFQRSHPSRVIGQESNALQIQIEKDLSSQSDLAMNLSLAFGKRWQTPFPMKREKRLVPDFLRREAFGRLVQVDQRTPPLLGNNL